MSRRSAVMHCYVRVLFSLQSCNPRMGGALGIAWTLGDKGVRHTCTRHLLPSGSLVSAVPKAYHIQLCGLGLYTYFDDGAYASLFTKLAKIGLTVTELSTARSMS